MKNRTLLCAGLAILLVLSLLTGCSKPASSKGDAIYDNNAGEKFDSLVGEESAGAGNSAVTQQKKIRKMQLQAETEDLDALLKHVEERLNTLGGYVEQKEVYRGSAYAQKVSRNATLTLRVPAERADDLVEDVGEVSNITSSSEQVDDVTLQYVATSSRITALETEQTRLLELLAKAKDMNDLLLIESRLTEVRAELEQVKSQLKVYDNLVDYATIKLSIREVREYTPTQEKTFWQRIGSGLSENFKNVGSGLMDFLVFLITAIPYFLIIAVVVTVFVLAIKARKKRKKKE